MKSILHFSTIIAAAVLSAVIAGAQTGNETTKHYDEAELAFDYPEGWESIDGSSEQAQTVTLRQKAGMARIVVSSQDYPTCDFELERKKIEETLTKKVSSQTFSNTAYRTIPVKTQIAGSDAEGRQLQGIVNRKQVTADIYVIRLHRRLVSLVYIPTTNQEQAELAWSAVRSSLKIEVGVITVIGSTGESSAKAITSGVVNGKAIALPKPNYPGIARSAHASGTVKVQVIVDEMGDVISAHAVEGHPLLQAVCVAAARQAKFSPTKLCGEPVRITGIITYNFVAQ